MAEAVMMEGKDTLYSLAQATRAAIEGAYTVDDETGEIIWSPDELDALELAIADKAEAVLAVQRGYQSKAKIADEEIKRLQSVKKVYAAQSERLRDYMARCVEANGKAIETPIGILSLRKSSKVEVLDRSAIPDDYMRYREPEPDKVLIGAAIKGGTPVPGCAIVESKNLRIR